jgi:hypothetical protein
VWAGNVSNVERVGDLKMIPRCPNCFAVLYEAIDDKVYECEICLGDFMRWEIIEQLEEGELDTERDPLSLVYGEAVRREG